MSATPTSLISKRLIQLSAHILVALIALVVIGGATRVMEAGLACPDWPLCYGSFYPSGRMNLQVFLEWFHRLDAFLIGISLLAQFSIAYIYKKDLPSWILLLSGGVLLLIFGQGVLGAFSVFEMLSSAIVTGHLILALIIVGLMSAMCEMLNRPGDYLTPFWWRLLSRSSLAAVFFQCLLGGRLASTWSFKKCLFQSQRCIFLQIHEVMALPVFLLIMTFVIISLLANKWTRACWKELLFITCLLMSQLALGVFSVTMNLSQPIITVAHQLVAVLLIASLSAISVRRLNQNDYEQCTFVFNKPLLDIHHG